MKKVSCLREFSLPLVLGVISALVWVNYSAPTYYRFIKSDIIMGCNLYFLVNDVFMAFFFALAGVELVKSLSVGGELNPLRRALNPLFASLGGVIGPILVYFSLNYVLGSPQFYRGWGIPTATDIALAWVATRIIFGAGHPVVRYILLLAIADDAIGLFIVAVFYPEPLYPVQPLYLFLVAAAMCVACFLRKIHVQNYWVYLGTAGLLSWLGLYHSYLHPALALIFIVPFFPHNITCHRLMYSTVRKGWGSTLSRFKAQWSKIVDFGLFMFGLTNAGVQVSFIGTVTWLVFFSLVIGKTVGIFSFANIAVKAGFPLPGGMRQKELFITAMIAAMGLTVALLITGAAFTETEVQGAAKMGALLSVIVAPAAFVLSKIIGVKKCC